MKNYFPGVNPDPRPTYENHKRDRTPLAWLAWLWALVLACCATFGCTTLPPCPYWEAAVQRTPFGDFLIIDPPNAALLHERLTGLAKGTCRHVPAPTVIEFIVPMPVPVPADEPKGTDV